MINNILIVGPLAEVDERLSNFAASIYLSSMMLDSIEQLEKSTKKYEEALLENDVDEIKRKKLQMSACEATVKIAVELFEAPKDFI